MPDIAPLTQKSINSIAHTGYLNVWEGSVRSSKTVTSLIAYHKYVFESRDKYFIMSGKTIGSLRRNCIEGEFGILALYEGAITYGRDSDGNRILSIVGADGTIKIIYCFGAVNEASYTTLRGITAGGWYADEISLHPLSFIQEAFLRTVVSKERKHFWTLNPESPYHFIYTEFIDLYVDTKLNGYYLWHFTLDDNLSLSAERKTELAAQYRGVFYRRYILGERCVAEGVIYDMFDTGNLYHPSKAPKFQAQLYRKYIAMDYGTTNPMVFLTIYYKGDLIYVHDEFVWDSSKRQKQKTDSEYCLDYKHVVEKNPVKTVIGVLDPSAESFHVELTKAGFFVKKADNKVIDGIRRVGTLLGNNKILINDTNCPNLISELNGYAWNPKSAKLGLEEPIKSADHCCDALRYFVNTIVKTWAVSDT